MWQGYLPKKRRMVHSKIRRQVRNSPREIFQNASGGKKLASRFSVPGPTRLHSRSCEHGGGCLVWLLDSKHCRRLGTEHVEKLSWAIQVQHSARHRRDAAHRCKPMHCKIVLNQMDKDYAGATIRQTYICMGTMLKSALMNDLIPKHPMDGVRYTKPVRAKRDRKPSLRNWSI